MLCLRWEERAAKRLTACAEGAPFRTRAAELDCALQLESRAELCVLFVSWRTTAEQLCVRQPCAAASVRALSVAAVMSAAQARALLQPLPSTTSIPCHALYAGIEESVPARCGTQWEARFSPWKMRAQQCPKRKNFLRLAPVGARSS